MNDGNAGSDAARAAPAADLDAPAPARTIAGFQGDPDMSSIDIRHPHSLAPAKARKAVEDVAKKLAERFDVEYNWDGDVLNFARSGVDGKIAVGPEHLRVTAQLGFLLGAMKGPIEAEIRRVLEEKFK